VVLALGVLFQSFGFAVRRQEIRKVDNIPARELRELRAIEAYALENPTEADPPATLSSDSLEALNARIDKSTDAAIKSYINK